MDVSKEYGKKLLSANDEFQSPQWGYSSKEMEKLYMTVIVFQSP